MTGSEWIALTALLLNAVAVLPGTLGVLLFTHKMAADPAGARYIYNHSKWVLIASAPLLLWALERALASDGVSRLLLALILGYGGILVFGFLMHAGLNFKPVHRPTFISAADALRRFDPDEEVIGVVDDNQRPYAFITRLARRPHVIYQPEGQDPFFVTHCILAHSSMSYPMRGEFSQPDIQVTAVLANNMVFYDKSTRCSVTQIQNRPRSSERSLPTVPTVMVSLKTWCDLYPDSRVWVRDKEWRDTFYLTLLARTSVIDPASPDKVYPLEHPLDGRLPMKSMVLGVMAGGQTRAYPVSAFASCPVIQDQLGEASLTLWSAYEGDFLQVFRRELEPGKLLTFNPGDTENRFVDLESGSEWSPTGECLSGKHRGQRLQAVPHFNKMFWYVWADYYPETTIYGA